MKPRHRLKPYKVAKIAVTPNETRISINGLIKLTPSHAVITGKGVPLQASALKKGDTILRADKTTLTVQTIENVTGTSTVYNLVLDGGASFIADGIRVVDYAH